MANLRKIIARAIKDADKSWFNEDYSKQADAVLRGLKSKGYTVVQLEPTEDQVEAGKEALTTGRYRPTEVVATLYKAMVKAAK